MLDDLHWDLLLHGVAPAMEAYQAKNAMSFALGGLAIGASADFVIDHTVKSYITDDEEKMTPGQAALVGGIDETLSTLAMSVLLTEPLAIDAFAMSVLKGIPIEVAIHSMLGEVDWSNGV